MQLDRYQYLGIGLIGGGLTFAVFSYIVLLSIPLTALGLSVFIIGLILLQVPSNPLPTNQIRAMLEASLINVEALLEEYNALGSAVYLPSNSERVNAFIPLNEDSYPRNLRLSQIPKRVITKAGSTRGLLVFPPGGELVRLAMLPEDIGLKHALNKVLVHFTELANSVKSVEEAGQMIVELGKPKTSTEHVRVNKCLGSLPMSIAGCVIAHVLSKPVHFLREEITENKTTGFFDIDE